MAMTYLRLACCFLFIVIIPQTRASDSMEDVVYLKNGSVVRGQIIEHVPGKYLRVRTIGGSVFVFEESDIDVIKKEPQIVTRQRKNSLLAAVMSIVVPGSGHFYTGDIESGCGYLLQAIVGLLFEVSANEDDFYWGDARVDPDDDSWKSAVGLGLWADAVVESATNAFNDAKRINKRNQQVHLIQHEGDRYTVGIDAITSRKRLGTMLSLRF